MKKIINKLNRFFKFLGALFYLLFYRIRYIGKKRGVAQVVNSFNSGGLEQVAANVYKSFKDNGDISKVICLSNLTGPMFQQIYTPKDIRIVYYDLVEMIKYCAKNNIGTLIFHFTTFHLILFKFLGFKNYYVVHNTYIWYTENEWKKLIIKLKFVNGIIAVSEWCKTYFSKKTGYSNIKLILNGINFNNLDGGEISSITRESLNIKDNDIVCLTIGSYTSGKHQMEIVGIAEEIIKKNKNIKFITAGPILDDNLYNKFVKMVKKSSAKNNIIILSYIPQEEMGSFIENVCDIYLQPSIHEAGVPLSVMEALLKGKPVVMTDFMVAQTFPLSDRIIGVIPPYDDIMDLDTDKAYSMSLKSFDRSTIKFADAILDTIVNLDKFKQFNRNDYNFLSLDRMAREYIDYIKL